LLALVGWPEVAAPPGAWSGTDPAGRALLLAQERAGASADRPGVAVNEDGSLRAVLAGAVYNQREIRASLAARHAFTSRDDAEVVLHLYEERGVSGLKALRGPFAVALWDARRGHLVLGRDPLGLQPLYYAAERTRLAVSSSLPRLTGLPGLTASFDAAALDAFLVLGTIPPPATLYPAIRQLHPGEALVWENGRVRAQRYWHLAFPERRLAPAALGPMVREQLVEAVRLRQAGATAGLLLSGGLDAATLLALMVSAHRPPTRAYTAGLPAADEARAAACLAQHAGVEHVVVSEPLDWAGGMDALLAAQAGPVGGPEALALALAAGPAAAAGAVVIAGVGGEEVFGGGRAVRRAEQVRRYRRLPGLVREGTEVWARLGRGRFADALGHLIGSQRLAPVELYARTVSRVQPEARADLYTPEALAVLGEAHPWAPLTALFAEAAQAGAVEVGDVMHYVELVLGLPARVVAAGAACPGLDLRLPLADHRLAHLLASAPAGERGSALLGQRVLRTAMSDLVPAAVLRRPHVPFAPPPAAWRDGALGALVEETLAPARLAADGVFRPEVVARLRVEHASGRRDHGACLWAILLATRWLARRAPVAAPSWRAAG
jgi:asparagine synthase (glutamine-hydrolysing)